MLGALAGGIKTNEASTTLLMIDNRSGVQLAAAEGTAKNTDFALFGAAYGWAGAGAAGGYSSTPEGKIIIAAFADSYNQLVKVVRNYRAQTVKGGLGTGGALGVQGGSTPAAPNSGAGVDGARLAVARCGRSQRFRAVHVRACRFDRAMPTDSLPGAARAHLEKARACPRCPCSQRSLSCVSTN